MILIPCVLSVLCVTKKRSQRTQRTQRTTEDTKDLSLELTSKIFSFKNYSLENLFYIFVISFNGGSIILPYLLIFPGINMVSWPESISLRLIRVEAELSKKLKKSWQLSGLFIASILLFISYLLTSCMSGFTKDWAPTL